MTGRWSAVLFDFDYTLGDTERGIVASTRYAVPGSPPFWSGRGSARRCW